MSELYKVVEDQSGVTAYAGPAGKNEKPNGLPADQAEQVAAARNAQAKGLGIKTRYRVEAMV